MFNYILYRVGIFVALHTPRKIAYRIACIVSDFHFFISKKDRKAVFANLRVILGGDNKDIPRIARLVFRNFAKYLADFFCFSKIDQQYLSKFINVKNIHNIDRAIKKGKGVIILSAHLGNWELGAAVFSKLGYALSVVALDHKNKLVNDFFITQRNMMGVGVIPIGIALRKCFALLKNNGILALLGDRDFSPYGVKMKFFGKETLMPKGPAAFSLKTGAAIVPVFLLRNPDDTFDFIFEEEITYSPTGNFEQDEAALTEKIVTFLEGYIRDHLDQWYLFRRFWESNYNE